jgi:hypothetical protein
MQNIMSTHLDCTHGHYRGWLSDDWKPQHTRCAVLRAQVPCRLAAIPAWGYMPGLSLQTAQTSGKGPIAWSASDPNSLQAVMPFVTESG